MLFNAHDRARLGRGVTDGFDIDRLNRMAVNDGGLDPFGV